MTSRHFRRGFSALTFTLIFLAPQAISQDFCALDKQGSAVVANPAYNLGGEVNIPVVFHVISDVGVRCPHSPYQLLC